jgi:hypothetical protein
MVLGLFSALLFFADPLQLYMSAIPAVIFLLCDGIIAKYHFKNRLILAARTIGALGIGFILAKCMTWFVQKLFGIEFIVATNQRGGTSIITIISDSIVPAAKQAARLYVGGYELGRYVEALNLLFVAVIVVAAVWYVLRKNISRSLCSLIALVILVNMSIYIASGQALQGGTSRYLIMTVPFFVLLIALVTGTVTKAQKLLIGATLLLLVTNTLALFGAVYYNWNPTFSRDAHTGEAISYMKRSNYTYGYASMDTALSSNYLSGYSAQLLPIKCEPNNTVESAFLFFDKANYKQSVSVNQAEVPLILDNEQIGNYPSVCSIDTIKSCLGSWEKAERLSDGSLVLIYNAAQVRTALGLTN